MEADEEHHRSDRQQQSDGGLAEAVALDVEGAGVGDLGGPGRVGHQLGERPAARRGLAEDARKPLANAGAGRGPPGRSRQSRHQRERADRRGHHERESPGPLLGEKPDHGSAHDPGRRLRAHHPAHRPLHPVAAEVGGHAREAGRQRAGHAGAGDQAREVEPPSDGAAAASPAPSIPRAPPAAITGPTPQRSITGPITSDTATAVPASTERARPTSPSEASNSLPISTSSGARTTIEAWVAAVASTSGRRRRRALTVRRTPPCAGCARGGARPSAKRGSGAARAAQHGRHVLGQRGPVLEAVSRAAAQQPHARLAGVGGEQEVRVRREAVVAGGRGGHARFGEPGEAHGQVLAGRARRLLARLERARRRGRRAARRCRGRP